MAKNFRDSFKNPVHIRNRHAVVANRDAVFDCHIRAIDELFACRHAASALNRHCVLFDIIDWREARKICEFYVFSCEFPNEIRQFHSSDVAAADFMSARFEHQDFVAVF